MTKKNFTDEQAYEFHKQYLNGKSIMSLSKEYNHSYTSILNSFKRLSLEILPQSKTRRKFPLKEDFFATIDSEEKAYMLGFIFADGCNHEKAHKLEISLNKQDEDILIKFSKILLDGYVDLKEYNQKEGQENRVCLYVTNKKITDDLSVLGCTPRKTLTLKFPQIPELLYQHFIRGYFDGDGMLVIYEKVMSRCINKTKIAEFSITSTKEMLDAISVEFNKLNVKNNINKRHKNRDTNNYTLRVFGNQQIKIVCDYLYKDSNIFLNRKHSKYLQLCEMSKTFRKKYQYE